MHSDDTQAIHNVGVGHPKLLLVVQLILQPRPSFYKYNKLYVKVIIGSFLFWVKSNYVFSPPFFYWMTFIKFSFNVNTNNQTNISSYLNAEEPHHVVIVFTTPVTGALQLNYESTGGPSNLYKNIAIYDSELTVDLFNFEER